MSLSKTRVKKGERISHALSNEIFDKMKLNPRKFDRAEFNKGMNIELEHYDITKGDLIKTAKITIAHLNEIPDYNTRLKQMEKEGDAAIERRKHQRKFGYQTFVFDDEDD